MKKTTDLGKDKVPLLVLKLAVPSMIAQFVNVLYSTVDRMFIGNIREIGDVALAGVGVCGPIVTLLTSFGTLIGLGGSILMAMRMGAGRKKQAENILAHSFLLLVIFSALLTLIFLLVKDYLLNWFGASPATFPYADSYMTIYTIGTFFALMAVGLNYFITCQGFPGVGMMTVIIGALTNIVLDPVFIFGFHMGVAGAAIATVIAQFVSCAFAFRFLTGKKIPIKITLLKRKYFSPVIVSRILTLGISPFLILATDSVILIVLNTVLQTYGGPKEGDLLITCATIVQSYMMLITGPMLGISSGTQAILSYNYGAKNIARVKSAEKYILLLCLCFTTIMFLVSRTIPEYFISIFTRDPAQIDLCVWGIRVFTMMIIPLSFQYVFVDGFTALGRSKTALFLSVFRKGDYMLFTMVLPIFFGARSAFYAQPLADGIGAVMSSIAFLLIFKKHLEKRMLA
ncbi:MAG TPA: MATE family efflux transporter [Candidatus Blautia ornithocaccae]|uniref:MATE family efflux transporter n=1 Tax=Blautia sp. An81 TaxID=1965659 RepID=UPI000B391EA3|nr:MATE family efflux transporter [Blautia sp. An81]OUN21792.1 MATE family efflux transporter [Blautia sp. An81]HJD37167.1 MATE family efflux transporter [Candidatus Blautia ornithocaccae]